VGSNSELDDDEEVQHILLESLIKKSGFCFLDVFWDDNSDNQSKDPQVVAVRQQSQAASDTDAGRDLSALCDAVADMLREQQLDAAYASVQRCHHLKFHPHASAYFQGQFALARGQMNLALDNFKSALTGPLPQLLCVSCHIGLSAALRGLRQHAESTAQLKAVLKIFPHNCELVLACAQHVLILGRSKDEAEALLHHAIRMQPQSISALLAMSRFQHAYKQSHSISMSYVDQALQIDPQHCDALLQRAIVHAAIPHSTHHDTRSLLRQAAAAQVRPPAPLFTRFMCSCVVCSLA
jgi:tetratricopeptide (TPR) repeat protein